MKNKISGVVPVLHTPINSKGKLDIKGLRKLMNFLAKKKIGGLWVLGTGGEDMNLTFDERLEVVRKVIEFAEDKQELIIGASFFSMKETLNFIDKIQGYKFRAIHIMPYHPLLSHKRLEWYYNQITNYTNKQIWVYTSANWCQNIPPSLIRNLKENPKIVGVKYSTSNTTDMMNVASLADKKFNVLSAVATTFLSSLCLGVDGGTSSLGGPLPEVLIEIYEEFKSNRINLALQKQRKLNNFLAKWPKDIHKDNFLKGAEEKFILSLRNICEKYMTSYYRECNKKEGEIIKSLLMDFYPNLISKGKL